jgi:hypothetical protein
MSNVLRFVGGTMIFLGTILILGVAGADCDGKCMENSLTLTEILLYTSGGICGIIMGWLTYNAGVKL